MRTRHRLEDGTPFTVEGLKASGWNIRIHHYRINKASAAYISMIMDFEGVGRTPKEALRAEARDGQALRVALKEANGEEALDALQIWPNGGRTVAEAVDPTGKRFTSEAFCSIKDSYNREIGLQAVMGRLAKETGHLVRRRE